MIISADEFNSVIIDRIKTGNDFYVSLLQKIIDNPNRYCGIFRLSNVKTKLIQNVTQSREIIFGDIIEDIVTKYIEKLGYKTFDKNLGKNEAGLLLKIDQYFTDGNTIFMVEMKIRDDHDSTKKRGQFSNFKMKIEEVMKEHPNSHIDASMWFVDSTLIKNKLFYDSEMKKLQFNNVNLHLYYGEEFFASLNNGLQAWDELISLLNQYHRENANKDVDIPDFGSSKEIFKALMNLSDKYWKKLMSNDNQYIQLRNELFSSGNNLLEAEKLRKTPSN